MNFTKGNRSYDAVYDKASGKSRIAEWLVIGALGEIYCTSYMTTDEDEFIIMQDAPMFTDAWAGAYSMMEFRNEESKQRIQEVVNNLNSNSNPVIIKLKFKAN